MKRELGRLNLLFISFAAIFGSGWLFAPYYAAQIAGPASIIAWIFGAAMAAVIGVTMAEVITLFPRIGGLNAIAGISHGPLLGSLVIVFNLLVFILLPAIEVRAVLQYLSSHSSLTFLMTPEGSVSALGYLFAVILIFLINLANVFGARFTALLTTLSVGVKLATPVILCAAFLYTVPSLHVQNAEILASFSEMPWTQIFQAIAVSGIIFSFNGFNQATVFAGEAKNPQKTIPFAILGSLLFSGLLYVLVQYVFLVSVPREYLAQGWSNLHFAGDQGPFAGIAALLGLTWLLSLIYADAVISPMGTAFTYASSAPRLFYAIAESNNIFPKLRQLNRFGVSTIAMLLTFVLTLISFALLPNLKAMISILVAAFVLCYTVAPASLLRFRKTHAHLPRHFRIPGALVFSYLSLLFSQLMVFSCGWTSVRNLLVAAGIMIGVYLLAMWRSGSRIVDSATGCEWFLLQIVGLSLLCYINHIEELPFTIVAAAIAVLSAVVLLLSQYRFHQAS